jgi:hypothetical protein
MKRDEIEKLIQQHAGEIKLICRKHGAPVANLICDGSLNNAQRARGNVGRVYVILADEAAGWRAKEARNKRTALKTAIAEMLAAHGVSIAVHIQANYSCLEIDGGMVVRRDASGKAIGAHPMTY